MTPIELALIALTALSCALAWIWLPYLRRRPEPQHATRGERVEHRRGPTRGRRIEIAHVDRHGRLYTETAEDWMRGAEPEWDWPERRSELVDPVLAVRLARAIDEAMLNPQSAGSPSSS